MLNRGCQIVLNALRAKYLITVDMAATVYIGIKLEWDYVNRTVILLMKSYVRKALHIFQNILRGGKKTSLPLYALTAKCQKNHEANSVTHKISGMAQENSHLTKCSERKIWEISLANELGQLDQDIQGVKGKNTVIFILKSQVPKDKKVTYGKIVCEVKPEKEEKERTILTVGQNLLDFTGTISAPTASVTTSKCVFNSVVSILGARCLFAYKKHFLLK